MLTGLHNDGTIDVLEPARQIASSPIDQHQFFTVMHAYTDLIPALEAEVPAMLAAVKALVARAGDDGAAGMPNGACRTVAKLESAFTQVRATCVGLAHRNRSSRIGIVTGTRGWRLRDRRNFGCRDLRLDRFVCIPVPHHAFQPGNDARCAEQDETP